MDNLLSAEAQNQAAKKKYDVSNKPPSMLRAAMNSAMVNEVKNVALLGKRVPVLAVKVVGAVWDGNVARGLGDDLYVSVHGQLGDGRVVQSASTRPAPRSSSRRSPTSRSSGRSPGSARAQSSRSSSSSPPRAPSSPKSAASRTTSRCP